MLKKNFIEQFENNHLIEVGRIIETNKAIIIDDKKLVLQGDNNLVLYSPYRAPARAVWSSKTNGYGSKGDMVVKVEKSGLNMYTKNGLILVKSFRFQDKREIKGIMLFQDNQGVKLALVDLNDNKLFNPQTAYINLQLLAPFLYEDPEPFVNNGFMSVGFILRTGKFVIFNDNKLVLQGSDNNLVLYSPYTAPAMAVWDSKTNGYGSKGDMVVKVENSGLNMYTEDGLILVKSFRFPDKREIKGVMIFKDNEGVKLALVDLNDNKLFNPLSEYINLKLEKPFLYEDPEPFVNNGFMSVGFILRTGKFVIFNDNKLVLQGSDNNLVLYSPYTAPARAVWDSKTNGYGSKGDMVVKVENSGLNMYTEDGLILVKSFRFPDKREIKGVMIFKDNEGVKLALVDLNDNKLFNPLSEYINLKLEKPFLYEDPEKEQATEEKPQEQQSTEENPQEQQSTEEKPQEQLTEEKPQEQLTEEKPQEQSTEEKSKEQSIEEKPQEQSTEEKPQEQSTEEKTKTSNYGKIFGFSLLGLVSIFTLYFFIKKKSINN